MGRQQPQEIRPGNSRALNVSVALRQPPNGCIYHTERGSQYCSNNYQKKILTKHGFEVSISGKGNS